MSKLSIKAIVVGGIVDITSSFALAIPVTIIAASRGTSALKSIELRSVEIVLGLICSMFGGFVAGRLAKQNRRLNGALSSWLCTALGVCAIALGLDHQPHSIQAFNFIAAPICALLGGYLSQPRKHQQIA
jgi:hypothetical protein